MKLALDAGHGFNTAGKRTPDDIREWTLNNRVVTEMQRLFKDYNLEVKRIDDPTGKTDISLNERDARMRGCDVLLSVHHNAYQSKWGNHTGTETLIQTEPNRPYATAMNNAMVQALGLRNRGVKISNTQILRNFKGKDACLVEVGFMDSNIDHPIITKDVNSKKVAKALVDAFVKYYNIKKNATPKPPIEDNGDWVKQNGQFTLGQNVWKRKNPSLSDGTGKELINKGTVVYYDAYLKQGGFTWLNLVDYYGTPTGFVMPWRDTDEVYGKVEFRDVPSKPTDNGLDWKVGDLIEFTSMRENVHNGIDKPIKNKNYKGRGYGYIIALYPNDNDPYLIGASPDTKVDNYLGATRHVNISRVNDPDILKKA